jgi:hypothetical protein
MMAHMGLRKFGSIHPLYTRLHIRHQRYLPSHSLLKVVRVHTMIKSLEGNHLAVFADT